MARGNSLDTGLNSVGPNSYEGWHGGLVAPYDLFISFADGDRDWVEGYLLPALGLPKERVVTGQSTGRSESFQPGAVVVDEFERAVTSSRFILLVLSRAYLADRWSVFSEQLASYASVAKQRDRMIPLLREHDCRLPLHIEFRVSLDCTEQGNWEAEIGRLRQLLAQPEPKAERIACPFPGMVPFQEKDARFFYGREPEIEQMLLHFRHQRLLFAIGPSGCGKSSLVFAGLLPQLQSSAYFDEGFWLVKQMRPGPHPVQELCRVLGGDPSSESVAKLLAANSPAQRLLLAVDQFEELFSQAERSEQGRFIAALKELRGVDHCALLITMRADFYPDLMNSDIWGIASSHRMEIAPLRGDALRQAIEKPAADAGVFLEARLLDRILADAADEPGVLPLVQETMVVLWEKMQRRLLTLSVYERLGSDGRSGIAVAMVSKADATLADLTAEQRVIARRIFLRLVQFGEGRADTRRQQSVAELTSGGDDPQVLDRTLRRLEDNRLVTVTGEERGQETKVDLAHEALIVGWPQLQAWVNDRRAAEQTRRRLENKAEDWVRLGRGKGALLDAIELAEAQQWLKSSDATELGYATELPTMIHLSQEAIAKQARLLRNLLVAVGVIAVIAVVFAVFAYRQSQTARSRQFVAEADAEFSRRPNRALALAVHAVRVKPTSEALELLLGFTQTTATVEHVLYGPKEPVLVTTFSADGQYLASEHFREGKTLDRIVVWDVNSGKPMGPPVSIGPYITPTYVAIGEGGTVATITANGKISLRDPASGGVVDQSSIGTVRHLITRMDAASKGGRFVICFDEGSVLWWNVQKRHALGSPVKAHDTWLRATAFSKDGMLFASGDIRGRVVIWNANDGTVKFPVDPDYRINEKSADLVVTALAFSEDGTLAAWAHANGTIIVWDIASNSLYRAISREHVHNGWITSMAFKGDRTALTLMSVDSTGFVVDWSIRDPEGYEIVSAARLPWPATAGYTLGVEGKGAAAWGQEGDVVIWGRDIAPSLLERSTLSSHPPLVAVSLSHAAQRIALQQSDGGITIQDVGDKKAGYELRPNNGNAASVAWLTNEHLAIGTNDGRLLVWDAVAHRWLPNLSSPAKQIYPQNFSLDGRRFIAADKSKRFGLWSLRNASSQELPVPKPLQDSERVTSLALSRDGRLIAVGYLDGSVGIWDTQTQRWSAEPTKAHPAAVYTVAFSPSGQWVASGCMRGYVVLWEVQKGNQFGRGLKVFPRGVAAVGFTSDSSRFIAVDAEDHVAVWSLDPESWIRRACQIAKPSLESIEWRRFMGDVPYPTNCGDDF